MSQPHKNARELLTAIGIGHFNATMIMPYMMIAPATTDPKSAQTILMVQAVQRALYAMGATDVPLSGMLDVPTARALASVVGPNWQRTTWGGNIAAIIAYRDGGGRIRASSPAAAALPELGQPMAVSGTLDFLPDVPGGLFTYAVGAFLLYRHIKRKARA